MHIRSLVLYSKDRILLINCLDFQLDGNFPALLYFGCHVVLVAVLIVNGPVLSLIYGRSVLFT